MHNLTFWKDKKVFVTGHTGFKGTWLCKILINLGARVTGYALAPDTTMVLFGCSEISSSMTSILGDVRDCHHLAASFNKANPEIVFHLAAQPLVSNGYNEPCATYETNVMGTVNILECIRNAETVRSFLNITTDKVYLNREWEWGYRENEPLDGFDPYSNSKSCSELITHCYNNSYLKSRLIAVSTARAGNVIGGGDFSKDRIIPDCIRAAMNNTIVIVRNPYSIRPYQHVLEPLYVYMMIAERQYEDLRYADSYNVGPDENSCMTTGDLADLFCQKWGNGLSWITLPEDSPHEANRLKLDCSKLKTTFSWSPRWNLQEAVARTIEWTKVYMTRGNISDCMNKQITEYFTQMKENSYEAH